MVKIVVIEIRVTVEVACVNVGPGEKEDRRP